MVYVSYCSTQRTLHSSHSSDIHHSLSPHRLSKKAKAAADVDYPAYGVTGPNIDTSGDRKLAHSAHMYHYQHQKQQIIAMER